MADPAGEGGRTRAPRAGDMSLPRAAGGAAVGAAGLLGAAFLLSRGRLHLDVGWGRSLHSLGPIVLSIDAPRELVFEHLAAPYLGRIPSALRRKLTIVEREGNLVVAEHRTPLPLMDAVTVEAVRFEPPARVAFRLLRGPVPHVTEEFLLEEAGAGTRFTYRGELGADLWLLGRWYGGRIVRPAWEGVVRQTLDETKAAVEEHAARRRQRGQQPR